MKRRRLGRTGLEVSEIGFGCGPTAGLMVTGSADEQRATVARALERGINYFDTAPGYGNSVSETNLGRTLKALGATPLVATKVGLQVEDLDDIAASVVRSVEASLARLQIARTPLIQLHNRVGPQRAAKSDMGGTALLSVDDVLHGIVDGFKRLRARGLVDHFGCSAYGGDMASVARLIDSGAFDALIINYSALNRSAFAPGSADARLRDYAGIGARAAKAGMGVIALRVLEGGALSDSGPGADARLAERDVLLPAARALKTLLGGAEDLSRTAIRFALSNDALSTVLVGISNRAQLDAAVDAAAAGVLGTEALAAIESRHPSRRPPTAGSSG